MSPGDDAFQVSFADLYSAPGLQVPWYAVLGAPRIEQFRVQGLGLVGETSAELKASLILSRSLLQRGWQTQHAPWPEGACLGAVVHHVQQTWLLVCWTSVSSHTRKTHAWLYHTQQVGRTTGRDVRMQHLYIRQPFPTEVALSR